MFKLYSKDWLNMFLQLNCNIYTHGRTYQQLYLNSFPHKNQWRWLLTSCCSNGHHLLYPDDGHTLPTSHPSLSQPLIICRHLGNYKLPSNIWLSDTPHYLTTSFQDILVQAGHMLVITNIQTGQYYITLSEFFNCYSEVIKEFSRIDSGVHKESFQIKFRVIL